MLAAFVFAQPQETKLEKLRSALRNAASDTIRMDMYMVWVNIIMRSTVIVHFIIWRKESLLLKN